MLIKSLKIFSIAWVIIAGIFVAVNLISIWYFQGFEKLQEIMSPFNVVNYVAMLATFSPAIGAHFLVEYLKNKKYNKE